MKPIRDRDRQGGYQSCSQIFLSKGVLFPQVRKLIDGLAFTPEGYSRAKSILVSTYGKPTVVANVHIKCITPLPIITGTQRNRVREFYEKLIGSAKALDTMNKLKDING